MAIFIRRVTLLIPLTLSHLLPAAGGAAIIIVRRRRHLQQQQQQHQRYKVCQRNATKPSFESTIKHCPPHNLAASFPIHTNVSRPFAQSRDPLPPHRPLLRVRQRWQQQQLQH